MPHASNFKNPRYVFHVVGDMVHAWVWNYCTICSNALTLNLNTRIPFTMKKISGILAVSAMVLLLTGCNSNTVEKGLPADLKSSEKTVTMNELNTIKACRAFVKAQQDFSYMTRIDDSTSVYASKIQSEKGKRDGLYWESDDGKPSPLGKMFAAAVADQTDKSLVTPHNGYLFKILLAQGESAPGGKMDYSTGGSMTKGFAVVAYPAKYGESGILTFIVSHLGVIYEKNLGEKTPEIAPKMDEYNPDDTWTPVSKD